jgi:uncharacterized protein YktB (UPF0637 family)
MDFNGFEQNDFDTFKIEGLEERMEAIRGRIQPKFKVIGDEIVDDLATKLGNEMFIHIAQHARRTVNPPNDTWMAFSLNKRGYKMLPHFQIGLWDDRLFVWLAYIYELPTKSEIAEKFIKEKDKLEQMIPLNYDISMNHMKKSNERLEELDLGKVLDRFKQVKSAELLIGKQFEPNDPIMNSGDVFMNEIKSIYDRLIPIYQLSMK